MNASRSIRVDFLKCIAILAVIFYHLGFLPCGYLGVDIFLVISGYFLGRSLVKPQKVGKFPFFSFLMQRLMRLWPLILLAAAASLAIGFFVMLPNDYENLAQSAVASGFFANNILPAITLKNYWAVINDYKPLMHTWYAGVLLQAYVVFALMAKLLHRFSKEPRKACGIGFAVLLYLSLVLYLLPVMQEHEKFYYIPARLFELALGALLAALPSERLKKIKFSLPLQISLTIALVLLLTIPAAFLSAPIRLLSVTLLTALLLLLFLQDERDWCVPVIRQLAFLGKASFSFFVWHQVIIAFIRYAWHAPLGFKESAVALLLIALVSILSYFFIESKLDLLLRDKKNRRNCILICAAACLFISSASLLIFRKAGVVRDVPELGIYTNNIVPDLHAKYCDRIYNYNRDFSQKDKTKVLVIGNSFGRDFANILLESSYAESIEISYMVNCSEAGARIEEADYIFYAVYGNDFTRLPAAISEEYMADKVYVVGFKNYGSSNGNIYNRRWKEDYLSSSVWLTEDFFRQNAALQEKFGDHYIDMITPVRKADGSIRVFTEEGKFISPDCHHLTVFGAQYYAELLDLQSIFQP